MNDELRDFRTHAHRLVDWMADYLEGIGAYPVKAQVEPGEVSDQLPTTAPEHGEELDRIFADFQTTLLPGVTHWQHPKFFAYFPANSSVPSLLAEMLTATLGIQGMKWETSPASTELETRILEWLRDAMGLPRGWTGVLQDTASTATLAAILTARERITQFEINRKGFAGHSRFRIYCSQETHSSIEKGAKIAGVGSENVVKIAVNERLEMRPDRLQAAIEADRAAGFVPLCIVAAFGTTSTLAIDPIEPLAEIARREQIWLHVDAAYAGTALLLSEYQPLIAGLEHGDSFVFNPHKWMFTNFDCSAYFVKDPAALVNTFAILPEYLKTATDGQVANHCDWGVPLGRRFRSLKLWYVLRYYGLEGIRDKLRNHIHMAGSLARRIESHPDFELVAPRTMNLVVFRYAPSDRTEHELNTLNTELLRRLNASGKLYLTHTKVGAIYCLRLVVGQTYVTADDVEVAWGVVIRVAASLSGYLSQKSKQHINQLHQNNFNN